MNERRRRERIGKEWKGKETGIDVVLLTAKRNEDGNFRFVRESFAALCLARREKDVAAPM